MQQLALTFEPGLAAKYRDLRECFAARVYHHGLGRVAAACDVQPSNLSAMCSGDRHLDVGLVERFMEAFRDTTPAMYLAARWLTDAHTMQQQALAAIPALVADLNKLLTLAKG